MNGNDVISAYKKAKSDRTLWENHWEEIAERVWPGYAQSFIGKPQQGDKRTSKALDGLPQTSAETFAKAMMGMITPSGQRWHKVRSTDMSLNRNNRVLKYFDEVADLLFHYRYLPTANFSSQIFENYLGLGLFGTGCVYLDKHLGGEGGFRYRAIHLAEMFFVENHQGIIDTAYRVFELTTIQMKQKFKNLPKKIIDARPDEKHCVIHCVKPNDDVDETRLDYKGMKFYSCYVLEKSGEKIEEGGYDTFPYLVSRYVTAPGETYGRSPAMMVLPNIKVLFEQKTAMLKQGHRAVDPIILTADDGVLDTFSLVPGSMVPGGMSADGKRLVDVLPTGDLMINDKLMDKERDTIKDAFLVNMFSILLETPRMTATEVLQRTRDKSILLAPTMGRQQTEMLGPMIDREIGILAELGLLPKMPPELIEAKGEYAVVYDSPLSRAARAEEAQGFMQTLEMAMGLATARQDPAPLDWLNEDVAIPAIAEITSTPAAWIRSLDEVEALRKTRTEMQEAQMAIQAAPAAASMMKASNGQ